MEHMSLNQLEVGARWAEGVVGISWNTSGVYTYNLDKMTVSINGVKPIVVNVNDTSSIEYQTYKSYFDVYGKSLTLSASTINFTGSFSAYNPASYTLNGENIVFNNSNINQMYSLATYKNDQISFSMISEIGTITLLYV